MAVNIEAMLLGNWVDNLNATSEASESFRRSMNGRKDNLLLFYRDEKKELG